MRPSFTSPHLDHNRERVEQVIGNAIGVAVRDNAHRHELSLKKIYTVMDHRNWFTQ